MSNLFTAAKRYIALGFAPHPVLSNKTPRGKWQDFNAAQLPDDQLARQFSEPTAGIGISCGAKSGMLEVIDVDTDKDSKGTLWEEFSLAIQQTDPELYAKLVIQKSRSGGRHLWYRCQTIEGNKKLAQRPATQAELDAHNADPNTKRKATALEQLPKTLIETRGEGGYVCAYPMAGYEFEQGSPATVVEITESERQTLMFVAESFSELIETPREKATFVHQQTKVQTDGERPGDAFNAAHTALELMEAEGWTCGNAFTDRAGDRGIRLIKPGSTRRDGSGVYYERLAKLGGVSGVLIHTTDTVLPAGKMMTAFEIFTHLNHAGDFKAAAKDLAAKGYGAPAQPRSNRQALPAPTETREQPDENQRGEASAKSDGERPLWDNAHFRILGFAKNESEKQGFYFFQKQSKVVLRLAAGEMSKNSLLTLAPLNWWEEHFSRSRGKGFDLDAAVNFLIQLGSTKGHFRDKMLRGRGAWIDEGRVVIHAGDRLIVDGKEVALADFPTKFVYESGEELGLSPAAPLPVSEAAKFLELCDMLNWQRSVNAALLAGWCVLAPACGALKWRPHIWLTGAAGTGKSWVFRNLVRRALGATAIDVQGNTSESGIRQTLQRDALPVVFDEAEGEDKAAMERLQQVLNLMRAASSEDGGRILKGGADGSAKQYIPRSCFAYASIGVGVSQQSDRSRVTLLELAKPTDPKVAEARFAKLEALYRATVTDQYIQRLQARTIALLPTILKNAETFTDAVRDALQNQRSADQLGILLAAKHSLVSDGLITLGEARAYVQNQEWEEERSLAQTRDELRLLAKIAEQREQHLTIRRSIGELVLIAAGETHDSEIGMTVANDLLKRCGLKVDDDRLVISDNADWLKTALRDSPWAAGHRHVLKRLDGALEVQSTRFASGLRGRAISIPLSYFTEKG